MTDEIVSHNRSSEETALNESTKAILEPSNKENPLSNQDTVEGSERSTDESSDTYVAARPDILYCLQVDDEEENQLSFYGEEPWKGVKGLAELDPDRDKETKAALVLYTPVNVAGKIEKKSNTSANWKENPIDFELGRDAKLFKRFSPHIKLYSKSLIRVMEALLDYYPAHLGDYDTYSCGSHDEIIFEIMYYYPELKEYLRSYTKSLDPEDKTLSIYNTGDAGGEEIESLMEPLLDFGNLNPKNEPPQAEEAYDIAVLLRLLAPMYRLKMVPILSNFLVNPEPLVKFENLWSFLRPGTRVYVRYSAFSDTREFSENQSSQKATGDLEISCCVVANWFYAAKSALINANWDEYFDRLKISLWSIEYNGTAFRRTTREAVIFNYLGYKTVREITVVPSYLYDKLDNGVTGQRLHRRGMKHLSILSESLAHREYDDPRTGYHGQIILDPDAYRQYTSGSLDLLTFPTIADGGGGNKFRDITNFKPSNYKDFDRIEEVYPLLPKSIRGFALKTREWMDFDIDHISDGPPNPTPNQLENELVLVSDADKESLRTVLPLGETSKSDFFDFVAGKGEGKIFLLYGPPGTGKTLTVECLANDTGRPLLNLTPQDVGLQPDAESSIRNWFSLAAKWNAILLIDEADIFLEQRREGDVGRNGLVTVFLRTMEYYKGVLFLTTNRPGHIDDSFISRITCPIAYSELSHETKEKIIRKFIKRIEANGSIDFDSASQNYLVANCDEFNGRELRNLTQNAVAAAEVRARSARKGTEPYMVTVKKEDVKTSIERLLVFRSYLKTLRNNKDITSRAQAKHDYLPTAPLKS